MALAKAPDSRRFVRGEIFAAKGDWDDFGMGRHNLISLRFTDDQGRPRELFEHFSETAWRRLCPAALTAPIPAWIVYDARDPKSAGFLGLPEEFLKPLVPDGEAKLLSAFNVIIMLIFVFLGTAIGGVGGLLGARCWAVCWRACSRPPGCPYSRVTYWCTLGP